MGFKQPTKEEALVKITELVHRFAGQYNTYKNQTYNETQTRRDFIDQFWKALGWDVANENNSLESYREVICEDRVKVAGTTKMPDYSFKLPGGKIMFYLEAKKPHTNIKEDAECAIQVRKYGWSAGLQISILMNFDYFSIYDCTTRTKQTDKASAGRIDLLTHADYITKFDFLWETFSREKVQQGGLDRYIQDDKKIKGTATVDKDFLESLDKWRVILSKNIHSNNDLNIDELNYVVQNILNRIVFLRIAEDRHIETYESLRNIIKENAKEGEYYKSLLKIFDIADQKYNSGLFDFNKDTISGQIKVDNKTIRSIILELYPDLCPYEFSVMAVEILGSSYEQFLGKEISLTKSGNLKIEEKPEVRKAGGVYYTPQYIVNYIVGNTVGKLIEKMTPAEVSKIKIVDPACGSGSFLIGAYHYLLTWHKDYYLKHDIQYKGNKNSPLTPSGELTTEIKKNILLNNIFGVDLDTNAVEVTKLSLLLKCMEGETKETIQAQQELFHDRVLPDLDNNIKSGNSLIDLDYYENELDFEEERKVKPFSWEKNFPEVFENGGFDCVIGNPPWVSLNGKFGNDILNLQAQQYLINKYSGNTYMPNLYEYFVHKGLELIKANGMFSFIVPDRLGFNKQFVLLRKKVLLNYKIEELLYKIPFPGIVTDTLIFRFTKNNNKEDNYNMAVGEFNKTKQLKKYKEYLNDSEYRFTYESSDNASRILKKIYNSKKNKPLGEIAETTSGFGGLSDKITEARKTKTQIKVIRGRSIHKYSPITPYYFDFKKENITGRTTDKCKLGVKEKVLLRKTGSPIIATYDESGIYPEQSLYFIFNNKTNNSLKYITALINSNLFHFIYINKLVTNKDSTPQLKKVDLDKFPICICEKSELNNHNKIVKYVDQLLQLNKELQSANLPNPKEQLQTKIDYCEEQINKLVYDLYELTEDEIKVVGGK